MSALVVALLLLDPPAVTSYPLAFLRRAPGAEAIAPADRERIQAAHLAGIGAMWKAGKLAGAGPFEEDTPLRGVFLFSCPLEEARALSAQDPAVQAGRLVFDLHTWRAPAGLGTAYRAAHEANPEAPDDMQAHPLVLLTRGPQWTAEDTEAVRAVRAAHHAHAERLRAQGELLAYGPFEEDGDLRAALAFRPGADAKAAMEADPAVRAGRFAFEIHTWWLARGVLPEGPRP